MILLNALKDFSKLGLYMTWRFRLIKKKKNFLKLMIIAKREWRIEHAKEI